MEINGIKVNLYQAENDGVIKPCKTFKNYYIWLLNITDQILWYIQESKGGMTWEEIAIETNLDNHTTRYLLAFLERKYYIEKELVLNYREGLANYYDERWFIYKGEKTENDD